jgi:hypothetical protein
MRATYRALGVAGLALAAELAGAQQATPPAATPASPPAADSPAQAQAAVQAFLIRLATIDVSDEAFQKLDTDHDGRVSALEANASPKVAGRFLEADRNRDGFLSRTEFKTLAEPASRGAPP